MITNNVMALENIQEISNDIIRSLKDLFRNMGIPTDPKKIIIKVTRKFTSYIKFLKERLSNSADIFTNGFEDLIGKLKHLSISLKDWLSKNLTMDSLGRSIENAEDSVKSFFQKISDFYHSRVEPMLSGTSGIWDKIQNISDEDKARYMKYLMIGLIAILLAAMVYIFFDYSINLYKQEKIQVLKQLASKSEKDFSTLEILMKRKSWIRQIVILVRVLFTALKDLIINFVTNVMIATQMFLSALVGNLLILVFLYYYIKSQVF